MNFHVEVYLFEHVNPVPGLLFLDRFRRVVVVAVVVKLIPVNLLFTRLDRFKSIHLGLGLV